MRRAVERGLWIAGAPARFVLLTPIRFYRATLSGLVGGRCRFYPSCSSYAEVAIRDSGAVRGLALTVWRVLRCSPLSKGGVDHPPRGRSVGGPASVYDASIQLASGRGVSARERAPA
jgi:putative membrane protein insertion efficiency factor